MKSSFAYDVESIRDSLRRHKTQNRIYDWNDTGDGFSVILSDGKILEMSASETAAFLAGLGFSAVLSIGVDSSDYDYTSSELHKVGETDAYKIKVASDVGETKWLNVDRTTFIKIARAIVDAH